MATTTIRVTAATRDRLTELRTATPAAQSLEDVIERLLEEHAANQLHAQMRRDAEHARHNSADLQEVRRVQAELDELSAW